ncbi:MAG: surface protein [Maribacter sp.]|jgi:surface protein
MMQVYTPNKNFGFKNDYKIKLKKPPIVTQPKNLIILIETFEPDEQIIVPIRLNYEYNYNWSSSEDGQQNHTRQISTTFKELGIHEIEISGIFPAFDYSLFSDARKNLRDIKQFGDIKFQTFETAFYGCTNLIGNFSDTPNLSECISLQGIFQNCTDFNADLSNWDVSTINDLSFAFENCTNFTSDLSNWNVLNLQSLQHTFFNCTNFNSDLSRWNTRYLNNLENTFYDAINFNSDLSKWNTQNVFTLSGTFYNCSKFNSLLNDWDVSNVRYLDSTFERCSIFNSPLTAWNTSRVTTLKRTFKQSDFNQDINDWDVSNVTDLDSTFRQASDFNKPLNLWDISKVTTLRNTFFQAYAFNQPLNVWNISNVVNLYGTLYQTNYNHQLSNWDTSNVTTMENLFGYGKFNKSIANWNTSKVQSFFAMFNRAFDTQEAYNIDLFDISNCIKFGEMFNDVTMDTSIYDSILVNWNKTLNEKYPDLTASGYPATTVTFDAGNSKYSSGFNTAPQEAKNNLITKFKWTITDGGTN